MSRNATHLLLACCLLGAATAAGAQQHWRAYPSIESGWSGESGETPPDTDRHAEFVIGRLMFPQTHRRYTLGAGGGDWHQGGTAWTVDYPDAERHLAKILTRLSTIDVRLAEQPVNLDDGIDAFYWPFLISGLVGAWELTDDQAAKLREYLLRGGFLLCDSFYGTAEWDGFVESMKRVFPDRPIIELPDDHPIFHVVYDLTDRPRIPTLQHLPRGYRNDGSVPHWRAVLDDDNRVMVMITYNNDIADGWQHADKPYYPHEAANLALRMGVNFAVYTLTH